MTSIYEITNFRLLIQRKYFPGTGSSPPSPPLPSWKSKDQLDLKDWVLELWMAYEFSSSYSLQEALLWNVFIFLLWLCFDSSSSLSSPQKLPTNNALSEGKWDISNTRWPQYPACSVSAYKGPSVLLSVMSLSLTFHHLKFCLWSPLLSGRCFTSWSKGHFSERSLEELYSIFFCATRSSDHFPHSWQFPLLRCSR